MQDHSPEVNSTTLPVLEAVRNIAGPGKAVDIPAEADAHFFPNISILGIHLELFFKTLRVWNIKTPLPSIEVS